MISVLFVCLGNICRSPAAEGILRHLTKAHTSLPEIYVRSCGLGSWYVGQLPDLRMREASAQRGVILSSEAQQFERKFFQQFDYIMAVNQEVLEVLSQHANTKESLSKLYLVTAFSVSYKDQAIPDPFYGNENDFNLVLDMLEDSCEGLIQEILKSKK